MENTENNFKEKFKFFINYMSSNANSIDFNYFRNLIIGMSIIIENKININIQNDLNKDLIFIENNILHLNDTHSENLDYFFSDFITDYNPDGMWSNYPNIWKENIGSIAEYVSKFNIENDFKEEILAEIEQFNNEFKIDTNIDSIFQKL